MAPESDGVLRKRVLKLLEEIVVEAGGPAGTWHTTEALVSGTIIFESKDGSESWEK